MRWVKKKTTNTKSIAVPEESQEQNNTISVKEKGGSDGFMSQQGGWSKSGRMKVSECWAAGAQGSQTFQCRKQKKDFARKPWAFSGQAEQKETGSIYYSHKNVHSPAILSTQRKYVLLEAVRNTWSFRVAGVHILQSLKPAGCNQWLFRVPVAFLWSPLFLTFDPWYQLGVSLQTLLGIFNFFWDHTLKTLESVATWRKSQ